MSDTADFASELRSALRENAFGLRDFQVTQETHLESTATVVLLEGETVTVSLSSRGFKVPGRESEVVHETLEQLLDSLSPGYRLASQQALFSRLEQFATAHADGGDPSSS